MTCSQQAPKSNFPLSVAVGMGIPFRMVIMLAGLPFLIIALFLFAVVSPHNQLPELLSSGEDWWHWVWHGEKKY